MGTNISDEQIKRKLVAEKRREREKRRRIIICVLLAIAIADGCLIGGIIGSRSVKSVKNSNSSAGVTITESSDEPAAPVSVAADLPIVNTGIEQVGNKGGDKFWSWYGFGSHVAWCACYVSWVENECGMISDGTAPKFSLVSDGASWFKNRDQWLGSDATPEAGDLIFFDWEQDGVMDHVGIVTAVVDDKVFAVEGNSSDRCRQKRYYIGDFCICGYGHIVQQ